MRTNDCFGKLSNRFASESGPIYLPNLGSKFSRTKSFCFENDVLLTFGLGMREEVNEAQDMGVGGSHSHPYYVNI